MRRALLPLLLCLPALAQTHLGVPGGKVVQLSFNHQATDPTGWRTYMVQLANDGTGGSLFSIPSGQALVITDISVESPVPAGYSGTLNASLSLRWIYNSTPTSTTLYTEAFTATGAGTTATLNRGFTAGRIFAFNATNKPGFYLYTPWDASGAGAKVMVTGYLVAYP